MQHTNLHHGSRIQYYCQCLTGSSHGLHAQTALPASVRVHTRTANGHGAEARIDAHLIEMGKFVVLQTITGSIRPMVPTVELD